MLSFKIAPIILLVTSAGTFAQMSFWSISAAPGLPNDKDRSSLTVGLNFYSDVPGTVTGVRFYKDKRDTGPHTGILWSVAGTQLASVDFSGEIESGWQQAYFPSPINIGANTPYIISYYAPNGSHAMDEYYPWATLSALPLHTSGFSPGVFAYGSTGVFPSETENGTNYWVDVLFTPATPLPPNTYSISGNVRGSAATLTLSGAASGSTATDALGNYSFSGLQNGLYVIAPSQSGFAFLPSTAAITINGSSVNGVDFAAALTPALTLHTVSLTWTASTSTNVIGYNVYRADASGGPYTRLNSLPVSGTSYVDTNVAGGRSYFYVATAVDNSNSESAYSSEAGAVVPGS